MFTQPCFIRKNTPELRKKLEELGYRYAQNGYAEWFIPIEDLPYLGVNLYSNGVYMGISGNWNNWIDCGTNEELFLALAALRNDTDINQWFVMEVEVYQDLSQGDWFKATDVNGQYHIGTKIDPLYCHKATVEELIEHFKEK